jgi:O-antigen/teichoic acid export membrane protein
MDRLIKKYKPRYQAFLSEKFSNDGSGWLMLQQLIIAPMSLITTVLLARILSISDYGYYKYVLSIYTIVAVFGLNGIYNISSLYIQKGEDEFFNLGFQYKKKLRWIPSLISLSISLYYFFNYNYFLGYLFLITIFSYIFVDTYDFTPGILGKGDFKFYSAAQILSYFISYFPPILTAYMTHDVRYVLMTMFFCQFIFRYFIFNYVKKKFGYDNLKIDLKNLSDEEKTNIKNFKKDTLSSSFTNGIDSFGNQIGWVVVFNRLEASSTAVYSLALAIVDFMSGLISAPMGKLLFLLSNISKEDKNDFKNNDNLKIRHIKSTFSKYWWLSFFSLIFMLLTLPIVYKLLFAKYLFSLKYAMLYTISLLSLSIYPSYFYFYQKRNFRFINIIKIFTLILNIFLLYLLSALYGVYGAIIATILFKFIQNSTFTFFMFKEQNKK